MDLLALVKIVVVAGSGLVLYLFRPTGSEGEGKNFPYVSDFIGLTHQQWVLIHDWPALIFVIIMAFHLAMHYCFMRNIVVNLKKYFFDFQKYFKTSFAEFATRKLPDYRVCALMIMLPFRVALI